MDTMSTMFINSQKSEFSIYKRFPVDLNFSFTTWHVYKSIYLTKG